MFISLFLMSRCCVVMLSCFFEYFPTFTESDLLIMALNYFKYSSACSLFAKKIRLSSATFAS